MYDDLKDEEYYMLIEKCLHECHNDFKKHKDPCCFICSLCGKRIKIELRQAHNISCRVSSGC